MTTWRFIDSGFLDGPANMAVDEALLACFDPATSLPVFRVYGWRPPAFSIGRFQDAGQVLDLGKCRSARIAVVRRITGGGLIYHADELTYAVVCAPRHIPATSSVKDSFRVLTSFILGFYGKLGLAPGYAVDHHPAGTRLGERTPLCFAGRESYDILVNGRKIGGNAQRRLKGVIFQHGSLPLLNSLPAAAGFLKSPPAGFEKGTASLAELGVAAPRAELAGLLQASFREAFGVSLTGTGLTVREEGAVARLLQGADTAEKDDGPRMTA
jgi:lipoate-protein ligase A